MLIRRIRTGLAGPIWRIVRQLLMQIILPRTGSWGTEVLSSPFWMATEGQRYPNSAQERWLKYIF